MVARDISTPSYLGMFAMLPIHSTSAPQSHGFRTAFRRGER